MEIVIAIHLVMSCIVLGFALQTMRDHAAILRMQGFEEDAFTWESLFYFVLIAGTAFFPILNIVMFVNTIKYRAEMR